MKRKVVTLVVSNKRVKEQALKTYKTQKAHCSSLIKCKINIKYNTTMNDKIYIVRWFFKQLTQSAAQYKYNNHTQHNRQSRVASRKNK